MIPWIKGHPAQTAVLALSIGLGASSIELYCRQSPSPQPGIDVAAVGSREIVPGSAESPTDRTIAAARADDVDRADPWRLFAAKRYVAIGGQLQRVEGRMFHPPVPNDWLLKHGLDPVLSDVLTSDPDKDGFTTLEEWEGADARTHSDKTGKAVTDGDGHSLGDDSTSPIDPAEHPRYHTRLFLERVEQIPFRLRFLAHDTDTRNPQQVTVQINAVPGRTEYARVGESLKHAPFDIRSFHSKEAPGRDGTTIDASEVVVVDRRTGEAVTLPIGKIADSPESYAILRYDWPAPTRPVSSALEAARFRLRKNETFRLPPNSDAYRVVQIRADGVDLVCPDGAHYTVQLAPR
jgi:hypothetical protein